MTGMFVIIAITLTVSFSLFTYRRTGITKTTITSGYIEFTYFENKDNVEISNAYPLADNIGAKDAANEYKFEVGLKTSSEAIKATYEVVLLDNNRGEDKYFNNEQIKIALIKNNTYVADTSDSKGIKLSEIEGFNEGVSIGEGVILSNQEIITGNKDEYKLRMWISSDVSYNNEIDEEGTMEGKYNGYKYSLKVRVNATGVMSITSETKFENINVANNGNIGVDVSDKYELDKYALTKSTETPKENEWQDIESVAKSKTGIEKVASIKSKHLTIPTSKNGTYYLHVKNKIGNISYTQIKVNVFEEVYEGKSILQILEDEEIKSGVQTLRVNGETYTARIYVLEGNQTFTSNKTYGEASDVASGTTEDKMAKNMVIVKVKGNLTINSGVTVGPYYDTQYGGPKGFTLYVEGKLTNNGTIDNSHGAYATGQNVYLYKNSDSTYETVPAQGALGGEGYTKNSTGSAYTESGKAGVNGVNRQTGGGGTGSMYLGDLTSFTVTVKNGGRGTSYSGGSGSGGIDGNINSGTYEAGEASNFGGTGGNGYGISKTGNSSRYAGGGAGNPGGLGGLNGLGNNEEYKGANGTGGLLIIYADTFENNGTISANGSAGGHSNDASGGSSGGGSVNIFYNSQNKIGEVSANGAQGSANLVSSGGAGGNGSITIGTFKNSQFIETIYEFDYSESIKTFTAKITGTYKLETWGAQGGSSNDTYYGGYGGYSTGTISLTKNQTLYVAVGGNGSNCSGQSCTTTGGYNGGGDVTNVYFTRYSATQIKSSGGGATHIGTEKKLLSLSNINNLKIVASGGGGAIYYHKNNSDYEFCVGGHGGGVVGTQAKCTGTATQNLTSFVNANQSKGGYMIYAGTSHENDNAAGSFGAGGAWFSAGGAGLYGGTGGYIGTGGGSGYINGLNNGIMYAYCKDETDDGVDDCAQYRSTVSSTRTYTTTNVSEKPISEYAKKGNGYARITYLGE